MLSQAHQLELLEPSDEQWTCYVESNPKANIFHHPAWISLLAECYGYRPAVVVVQDSSGAIRAGLPIMEVRSPLTGRRWVSLPFTDHCAPLWDDAYSLEQLTNALIGLSQERGSPVGVRWQFPKCDAIHPYSHHVLHTLALEPDCEAVSRRFTRSHRQNIRTAEKRGVRVESGSEQEQLRAYYRLHVHTRRRQGLPVQSWRFFELLGSRILDEGLGFIVLAFHEDTCLAGVLFLHWQRTLIAKYAASSEDTLNLRPNNPLFWTAIQWGCDNGYATLDFGRSDVANQGLRTFKDRWGAEESPLIYGTTSIVPPGPDRPLSRLMGIIIRNSPTWVCRAAGELLYKHVA